MMPHGLDPENHIYRWFHLASLVSKDSDILSHLRRECGYTRAEMRMSSCKSKITRTTQERGHSSSQDLLTLFPQGTSASLSDQLPPLSPLTKHNFNLHMSRKLHPQLPASNMSPLHSNRKPIGWRVLLYLGSKSQAVTSLFTVYLKSGADLRPNHSWTGELGHVAWNLATKSSEWESTINMRAWQWSIKPSTWSSWHPVMSSSLETDGCLCLLLFLQQKQSCSLVWLFWFLIFLMYCVWSPNFVVLGVTP